jgi:hypothetical protein
MYCWTVCTTLAPPGVTYWFRSADTDDVFKLMRYGTALIGHSILTFRFAVVFRMLTLPEKILWIDTGVGVDVFYAEQ